MVKALLIILGLYLVASLSAVIINYRNKQKGLKGISWVSCFNPIKFFNVAIGLLFKLILPLHVFEQLVLRIYDEDCKVCLDEGKCVGGSACGEECACGCDTVAKMYSPLESDSGENWGPIIWNKNKYEELRKEYPIEIIIKR